VFHFEWFKMLWDCYLKLWNVKEKEQWRNNNKRNIKFPIYKTIFILFVFPSLDPSYFQTSYFFNFLFILNNLKCYRNATWSFTNCIWTLMELAFVAFNGLLNFLLTPSILGGHNFFNFIPLFMIFNALHILLTNH
jgi:hypothetical protein